MENIYSSVLLVYILMPWKYKYIFEHYSILHIFIVSMVFCFHISKETKIKFIQAYSSIIKCEYLKRKTRDGEQTLKSSDLWILWACIFIKLQKQMFSENFRLFIDFHLWSLSKSVWGAPTGLQGFDEGVMFQTWLHTVPCQLLGYDNR